MDKHPSSELMENALQKMKEMIDANATVGEPITTADGMTLIPVSKVSYGFAGGGSDLPQKSENKKGFGGGIGAGVNITPIAFIIAKDDKVDLLYVTPTAMTSVDRIIEMVPDVMDKVNDFMTKDKNKDKDIDE